MTHDGSTQTRPLADDAARGMPHLPLWAASLTDRHTQHSPPVSPAPPAIRQSPLADGCTAARSAALARGVRPGRARGCPQVWPVSMTQKRFPSVSARTTKSASAG